MVRGMYRISNEGAKNMLCPHCGTNGHLEQVEFSPEYEIFFCRICGVRYIAYSLGNGEYNEPVPVSEHPEPPGKV